MATYNNILVILEPHVEGQIALQRAKEILNFSPTTKVTAFIVVYDFSYDLTQILSINEQNEIKNTIVNAEQEWIDKQLEDIQNEYPYIERKVIWQRNTEEAILKELSTNKYDLILKSPEKHNFIESFIFTPIDWRLLRTTNIPLLFPKDHSWPEKANILIGLSFENKDSKTQKMLNVLLFRKAQQLAKLINGKIHLVNATIPIVPSLILNLPDFSNDLYNDKLLVHNKNLLMEFAQNHKIPKEQCHVAIGQIDEILPELAYEIDACAVLIGNYARNGISAAIIGNTCEKILDKMNCDLLVVKSS